MLAFSLRHETTLTVHQLSLAIGDKVHVGRHPSCAVVVEDKGVSGKHIELTAELDQSLRPRLLGRDLSRNGTGILDSCCRCGAYRDLRVDGFEQISNGAELILPLRRSSTSINGLSDAAENAVKHWFTVDIPSCKRQSSSVGGAVSDVSAGAATLNLPDAWHPEDKTGRWRYQKKIGEGGLGIVYRAYDMRGTLGEVAIKVLKRNPNTPIRDTRHTFSMYRECQWSMAYLHNPRDPRFRVDASAIFARYLEDHTGFAQIGPSNFDAKRRSLEHRSFDWRTPMNLPAQPYVVMELVRGQAVQNVIDLATLPKDTLTVEEKRRILLDATRALEYLAEFNLIHRDFRGCNMHLISRGPAIEKCCLKVLDLGVMIQADSGMTDNRNLAVQAYRRRGETDENRRKYDWLPWEVRRASDGAGPIVNYATPSSSFDTFSLGVLALHLLVGKLSARAQLEHLEYGRPLTVDIHELLQIGLEIKFLQRMLGEADERPLPGDVLTHLQAHLPDVESGTERTLSMPVDKGRCDSVSVDVAQDRAEELRDDSRLPPTAYLTSLGQVELDFGSLEVGSWDSEHESPIDTAGSFAGRSPRRGTAKGGSIAKRAISAACDATDGDSKYRRIV